jgi:putative ubiquitin-RnfH superfamily antitoxin RatB of RatAB toxin-antitoxin module
MDAADEIAVEVIYATPRQQRIFSIRVPEGTTVAGAIRVSGLLEEFPEIDLARNKVGIFSRRVSLEHSLRPGDRIEIYRPLLVDPKTARHVRARNK